MYFSDLKLINSLSDERDNLFYEVKKLKDLLFYTLTFGYDPFCDCDICEKIREEYKKVF
jgi:hypothetical protein